MKHRRILIIICALVALLIAGGAASCSPEQVLAFKNGYCKNHPNADWCKNQNTTTTSPATSSTSTSSSTTSSSTTTTKPVTTTTTQAPTTTTTTVPTGVQPVGPNGTYTLDFRDEFNDSTLDASKWTPSWFGTTDGYSRAVNGSMTNCYDVRNVVETGGNLELRSHPNSDSDCQDKDGDVAPVAGAMVVSNNKYEQSRGVWEWRAFYPGTDSVCGSGDDRAYNWPAMWTNGDDWPEEGEIDVAEMSSSGSVGWNVHSSINGSDTDSPHNGARWCGQGWHTYTMLRTSSTVCFWSDGVAKGCSDTASRFAPFDHYILLENAFDVNRRLTNMNATVLVDYVRHWN